MEEKEGEIKEKDDAMEGEEGGGGGGGSERRSSEMVRGQ